MNILHLILDEKFILFFDDIFSKLSNINNRYLVQVNPRTPIKHIKGLNTWRYIGKYYFFSTGMKEDLAWADCIIAHYLTFTSALIFFYAPDPVIKVWSGWGGDYYNFMPGGEKKLFGSETGSLVNSINDKNGLNFLLNTNLRLDNAIKNYVFKKAIKKIALFSAPIRDDFILLQKSLGDLLTAQYIQLNYGSVKKTFLAGLQNENPKLGYNILVGNSATPTNNHIEAFLLLAKNRLNGRKIITPLSYGEPKYRNAILNKGKKIFGEKFFPIIDFLPLSEYNLLISKCSIVVMNHRRQQALGNIGAMLYCGAKVFLDESNPIYSFFKENGAYVYSTNLLTDCIQDVFAHLNQEQIEKNRGVLRGFWGDDIVMRNAQLFVDKVAELKLKHA